MGLIQQASNFFIVMIILSTVSCFYKPDYNLILFLFIYTVWNHPSNQRPRITYALLYTILIDLIWLIFWRDIYSTTDMKNSVFANLEIFGLHLSLATFLLKIIITAIIIDGDQSVKKSLSANQISKNITIMLTLSYEKEDENKGGLRVF